MKVFGVTVQKETCQSKTTVRWLLKWFSASGFAQMCVRERELGRNRSLVAECLYFLTG